jgi:hypothetical protein
MRITSLTVSNFRCFGGPPTRIALDGLTTFVGGNACGKTAALGALARLFGVTQGDRGIRKSDFHLPPDTEHGEVSEMSLFIEARIDFPELGEDEDSDSVPAFFRQMKVDGPSDPPHCRARLDAKWTRTTLPEGEIEETLSWVNNSADEVAEEHKTRVTGDQRSRIHVLYVPATRDPLRQLRQAAGTLLHRLLSAIRWSDARTPAAASLGQPWAASQLTNWGASITVFDRNAATVKACHNPASSRLSGTTFRAAAENRSRRARTSEGRSATNTSSRDGSRTVAPASRAAGTMPWSSNRLTSSQDAATVGWGVG